MKLRIVLSATVIVDKMEPEFVVKVCDSWEEVAESLGEMMAEPGTALQSVLATAVPARLIRAPKQVEDVKPVGAIAGPGGCSSVDAVAAELRARNES